MARRISKTPARPTLIARVIDAGARRKKQRSILDEREFEATDFTRAWRSMRCWAWRHGWEVETDKTQARTDGLVCLRPPTANKTSAE